MKLSSKITVNTHYTRSVNVERDANSLSVVRAYIPTSRALRTLERVASAFDTDQAPRAWSLVGPYGSGKSSFSVFLSQLLSFPDDPATKAAFSVLKNADAGLGRAFSSHTRNSEGYCRVLITGSPEPLGRRLLGALSKAAREVLSGKRGKPFKVVCELEEATHREGITTSELLDLVSAFQDALSARGFKGLIISIDELGKFLEFEARHYGANDIFLLQALAEHACKGSDANLFLFVLLHQSFEQYAKGLGENLKKEWSKVQGRFEEVPFLESAEQVLRVVATAIEPTLAPQEKKGIVSRIKRDIAILADIGAIPSSLPRKDAEELFTACYPLHPVSAVLLPLLCQKIAQNERTLFSYLGSQEPSGLADLLKSIEVGNFIYPHHIYDYFITNQPAVLGDHFTHRRWVEVVTALDRLGDADPTAIELLKTIGLLNIVGAKGGLKASRELLETCSAESSYTKAVKKLTNSSVITYRKFNGEYRVWQGSDFDLEEALQEELGKLGNFSLAQRLSSRKVMLPVVARRYTIENGALRYFQPVFVDAQSFRAAPQSPQEPTIVFFLAAGQDDESLFHSEAKSHFSNLCITALCLNGGQLREATAEVIALKQIEGSRQELGSDPIAKREFHDRLAAAEAAEDALIQDLLDYPEDSVWHWGNSVLKIRDRRSFQVTLSKVLSDIYCKAPSVRNELINRDRPSSQAAAARNKLLSLLLDSSEKADLGIERFPPEKAIYRSVLRETGLHVNTGDGCWALQAPPPTSSLYSTWQRIEDFLSTTEAAPRSFAELTPELLAPPYGVKEGLLPILYVVAVLVNQHEVAIYEERLYRPAFTVEMLERFVKRPEEFTFQRFRIEGLRASIFSEYSKALFGDERKASVVDLVRPLATFIRGLPDYTQKTRSSHLTHRAQAVRTAFNSAKSPEHLLFHDLPKALGFSDIDENVRIDLSGFAQLLQEALRELKYAYRSLLEEQERLLAAAFGIPTPISTADLRAQIISRFTGLEDHTVDADGLRAFIKRLTKADGDDMGWLQNILMFLGQKPAEKWTDDDRSEAEVKLADYGRRISELELLSLEFSRHAAKSNGDFDVILLKTVKRGQEPIDQAIAIPRARRKEIDELKSKLASALAYVEDVDIKLGALAEFAEEFLKGHGSESKNNSRKGRGRPKKAVIEHE